MQTINVIRPALSMEQVIRFCGAVQDFNPIHYDEAFARAAGLPGVIAQGPLTYLLALDSLIAAKSLTSIGGFSVRFKAPVVPGATLSVTCDEQGKVTLIAGDKEALSGTVITQAGRCA